MHASRTFDACIGVTVTLITPAQAAIIALMAAAERFTWKVFFLNPSSLETISNLYPRSSVFGSAALAVDLDGFHGGRVDADGKGGADSGRVGGGGVAAAAPDDGAVS
jgi:hypothetical protein